MKKALKIAIIFAAAALIVSPYFVFRAVRQEEEKRAELECRELYTFCTRYLTENLDCYRELSEHLLKDRKTSSPDRDEISELGYDPDVVFSGFEYIDIRNVGEIEYSRSERNNDSYILNVSVLYTDELPEDNDYEYIADKFYGRYYSFLSAM